jgi:hypothetical protein
MLNHLPTLIRFLGALIYQSTEYWEAVHQKVKKYIGNGKETEEYALSMVKFFFFPSYN